MNGCSRLSKGQIFAALTLILPVLLGVMAFGVDFSIIYLNWALVQKAADAAALAGASQLTGKSGSAATVKPAAVNYVNGYACLNGITDASNSYATLCPTSTKSPGWVDQIVFTNVTDTQVSVGIHRSVPYFFGKLIGLQQASVAATATAAILAPATIPNGLFPVGLQCTTPCSLSNLDPGQTVTFGSKFVGGLAPGNWQWVDAGGGGSSALGNAIRSGASGSFSIGQTITSAPGNKGSSGQVKNGLNARLASCSAANKKTPLIPGTTGTDPCQNGAALASNGDQNGIGGTGTGAVPLDDPCLVTVAAVDYGGCTGACSMAIQAFAEIYLEQSSTTSQIDGCFVQPIDPIAVGGTGAPNLGPLGNPVLIN
jgi:Flp pilus assembly protein TadG